MLQLLKIKKQIFKIILILCCILLISCKTALKIEKTKINKYESLAIIKHDNNIIKKIKIKYNKNDKPYLLYCYEKSEKHPRITVYISYYKNNNLKSYKLLKKHPQSKKNIVSNFYFFKYKKNKLKNVYISYTKPYTIKISGTTSVSITYNYDKKHISNIKINGDYKTFKINCNINRNDDAYIIEFERLQYIFKSKKYEKIISGKLYVNKDLECEYSYDNNKDSKIVDEKAINQIYTKNYIRDALYYLLMFNDEDILLKYFATSNF